MEIKFRPIEEIVNDLIIKCADYCYNGWRLHAIGTTSTHKFSFILIDDKGNERQIKINQFEEESV